MNQAKTEALLEHIQQGGSIDEDSLAAVLSIQSSSKKTMAGYLAAVEDLDEHLEDLVVGGIHFYSDTPAPSQEDDEDDEEEDDDEEEQPSPPKKKKAKAAKPSSKSPKKYRFFMENSNGISVELEKIESKSGASVVTFREKPITDIVKVMLKGEVVEVDLVGLRLKAPSDPSALDPEITNERLLSIALAARA